MTSDLLERARSGRKCPAALKVQLSQLRSRFDEHPILVLEGVEDVGCYETWINRVANVSLLKILPGNGKEQLLGLRTLLVRDETGLNARVYFAVDRDFDDLLGQPSGGDIYCTDRYSVENYLIGDQVVSSLLRDEFRLAESTPEFDLAMKAYRRVLQELIDAIRPVNFRIYCCRRLRIPLSRCMPELKKFVQIELTG